MTRAGKRYCSQCKEYAPQVRLYIRKSLYMQRTWETVGWYCEHCHRMTDTKPNRYSPEAERSQAEYWQQHPEQKEWYDKQKDFKPPASEDKNGILNRSPPNNDLKR